MPITEIDDTVALIVVDLQAGTAANPTAHPIEDVVANAAALVDAFRARGLPVVFATVTGTPAGRTEYGSGAREFPAEWSAPLPRLDPRPGDIQIGRATWSVFAGTGLDGRLRALGVTQVVLAGLATSFGVESSARQAYDLGFGVVLATDAASDPRLESHDATVARVIPALGQNASTAAILALLEA